MVESYPVWDDGNQTGLLEEEGSLLTGETSFCSQDVVFSFRIGLEWIRQRSLFLETWFAGWDLGYPNSN